MNFETRMWFVFAGFFLSLIYAALFGYIARESMLDQAIRQSIDSKGMWTIGFLWLLHFIERFKRHIQLREPFFEFRNR